MIARLELDSVCLRHMRANKLFFVVFANVLLGATYEADEILQGDLQHCFDDH